MKHLLLTTIAAVLVVACGESQPPKAKPANPEAGRALLEAARDGNIEAVKQHLAAGTDVNAKASRGWTPLHSVATKEIAELLIANGADVNAKGDRDATPLHGAAFNGHAENAELLIAAGADVNAKVNDGRTPLDLAEDEIADLIRKHGGKTKKELEAAGN